MSGLEWSLIAGGLGAFAGAMTGAGFALMAFAIFRIVQHLRAQHRRPWK